MIVQSSALNAERLQNKGAILMMSKSKYIALICGAVSVAVTVIFYLLVFDNIFTIAMRWISLLFLILAETIFTVKAFFIDRTIFGVSNIVASIMHIVFVLMLSIVFVNLFPLSIKRYILLNILALCVLLVVDIVIQYFANRIEKCNKKLDESKSVIGCCIEKSNALCVEFGDTIHKNDLEEIVELLKYSDNSSLSQDEINIMNMLDELNRLLAGNDDGIIEKINEVKNAIKLRSIKVAGTKRGSY